MKRKLQALLVLLLLGAAKLPLEQAATLHLRATKLLSAPLDLATREQLTQMSFAAAGTGARSLVATITYLRAYREWEYVNWAKVDSLFELTTSLQPRYENYWDEAAWQMAFNAASYYLYDDDRRIAERRIDAEAGRALNMADYKRYVQRGIEILHKGLKYLPDSARLWSTLGDIYATRTMDPREATLAAEAYLQVHRISHNDRYSRFAAYQYAKTPDPAKWRKAYDLLRASYQKKQVTASLIDEMKRLEEKLDIPYPQRIPLDRIPIEPPADPYQGEYK